MYLTACKFLVTPRVTLLKRQNSTRKQRGVKLPLVVSIFIAKFGPKKKFAQPGY